MLLWLAQLSYIVTCDCIFFDENFSSVSDVETFDDAWKVLVLVLKKVLITSLHLSEGLFSPSASSLFMLIQACYGVRCMYNTFGALCRMFSSECLHLIGYL